MAMSLLPPDLSVKTAKFTFIEFIQSVGLDKGGKMYQIFEAAVNECMGNVITIDTPGGWEKFTWFSKSTYNKKTGYITMTFSDELAGHLIAIKKMYAKINLIDLGKLSSRYALRIYEIAVSYSSLAGKNGNAAGCWYFEREITELRTLFAVGTAKYKATKDFRKNVIDIPVKEINKADIGIEITAEYKRMGKFLHSVCFHCERKPRAKSASLLIDDRRESLEEKELEKLKKLYPDEYAELFKAEMEKKEPFPLLDGLKTSVAGYRAALMLKEIKGIKK
jgi:plasmid replication initiation protein